MLVLVGLVLDGLEVATHLCQKINILTLPRRAVADDLTPGKYGQDEGMFNLAEKTPILKLDRQKELTSIV